MLRTFAAAAGIAMIAGSANAAFLGLHMTEVTGDLPAATNLPAGTRVFRMWAEFDGAGTADGPGRPNTVLSVGNSNPAGGTPLFFEINKTTNPGANFFQATAAQGATASNVGGPDVAFGNPRALWDTYLSIGLISQDSDLGIADSSSGDPDFLIANTDGVTGAASLGLGAGHDRVSGGWFNTSPPNLQGAATDQGGRFLTFLGQFAIAGLANGAALGTRVDAGVFESDIFSGELTVNTQASGQGADANVVTFRKIPTPGALALFGVAGLAGCRRRR